MNQEKTFKPSSGYLMIFVAIALLVCSIPLFAFKIIVAAIPMVLVFVTITTGFFFINPNGSIVLTLFGEYKGTVKTMVFIGRTHFIQKRGFRFVRATLIPIESR